MADNTIANAIKFLKGEEKSLPATKTEGQVYFAYKNVGTAEKPSYTGAIYIDTPIGGTQTRVKMTANADIADKAFNDSAGLNIRETYLSSLGYTDDGKQTILIKGSGNNQTKIALPIASTTKSGIVTTDAQSFGGTKTFATINSTNLTVTGSSGFNYSGIETATESKARPVWFADSSGNGKPVINTNFTYNPATQTLSVANLSGTADKANKDNAGYDIRSTYISNITLDDSIMTITKGSGATSTLSIKDKLYSGDEITTKDGLDDFIETNVFKFGHIGSIEGYNGLEKNDGIILSSSWKTTPNYGHQIFIDDNGYALRHRYRTNKVWSDWVSILDSTNYNSYAPTKTGGGASGTWGINISGNAASANKLNTNAGSAILPVYFSNGVPVVCNTNLGVSITGNAASATKLTSSAGSVTQPIYFKDGKPVVTTYSLNKSVPADAKFTDTNTWRPLGTTGDTACAGNDSRLSNARPASDVYAWAKASTKPSYSWGEITNKPSTFTPSSHDHSWLVLSGYDTISSAANDTTANWGKKNISFHFYSKTGQLIDQPFQYGYLFNVGSESEVHQLWMEQPNGSIFHRGGNASGWSGTWQKLLDSSNYTSYTVTKSGSGASGTWGINVSGSSASCTGNAATATKLQTARTITLAGSVTGSGTFDGSGNLSITTSTNHSHSQYLPLAGGTMTGTINFTTNELACRFGGSTSSYYSGVMHQNFGTEAVVFAATNILTSFIFKCGQSPISMANNTWANITPSMQIKKQSVYINSLIANGVTPDYNLYVNGTTRCNGTLGVGNGSSAEIDFFPNSSSTIGARIKAYNNRIEFVFV